MKGQKGAVTIIEATFVFPIMFFVIFIMLMACEAYFQYARVEQACITAAINGAARCENPALAAVDSDKKVPSGTQDFSVKPYRYILTGDAKDVAADMEEGLDKKIASFGSLAFVGIKPVDQVPEVTAHMNIFISSFEVSCSFDIKLPIRMIFSNEDMKFHYEVHVTEPVGDPAEFIRTVSTVQDLLERSPLNEKIQQITAKVNEMLDKIARFIN